MRAIVSLDWHQLRLGIALGDSMVVSKIDGNEWSMWLSWSEGLRRFGPSLTAGGLTLHPFGGTTQ